MTIYIFFGILAAAWLVSVAASILAIWWSHRSAKFWLALVLSVLALVIAYYGLTHFHFTQTTTTNGQVTWKFDSHWPFIGSVVLGGFALAYTVWRKIKGATQIAS